MEFLEATVSERQLPQSKGNRDFMPLADFSNLGSGKEGRSQKSSRQHLKVSFIEQNILETVLTISCISDIELILIQTSMTEL